MLVLTRKRDEKIQIGRYITVSVQRIASGHVRLGIEAPPGVQIMRGELVTRAVQPSPRQVNQTLNCGDTVKWTSQSAGTIKTKRGKIWAVVPAGIDPRVLIPPGAAESGGFGSIGGCLSSRPHKSYLVDVGGVLYWPRVCQVRKVEPPPGEAAHGLG